MDILERGLFTRKMDSIIQYSPRTNTIEYWKDWKITGGFDLSEHLCSRDPSLAWGVATARRKPLPHKDLGRVWPAPLVVNPYAASTYNDSLVLTVPATYYILGDAKRNAKCYTFCKMLQMSYWHTLFSSWKLKKNIFCEWHGNCIYIESRKKESDDDDEENDGWCDSKN